MTELRQKHSRGETASILLGAAFLMATSAIGPGFITQTTVFTEQLKAAFAFAIVVSILVDIVVQLNVWRILAVSGLRGQDVAKKMESAEESVTTALPLAELEPALTF